ncbi:MAG TPA: hypothetical protein VEQ15_10750 [Myxococcales bacterium]|nr:hypothetical protein [Myxococcales bacterium]
MIALLLAAAAAAPAVDAQPRPAAHPFALSARPDKAEVTLGEPFTITIRIEHAALDVVALPEPLPVEPLALRGAPIAARATNGDRAETTFTVPLVVLKSLEPHLPALALVVDGPEGARQLTVPETPIRLRSLVAEERAPNPEQAHHGPKPPVPVLVRSFLWAWVLGGLLVLVAGILFLREARRRRALRPAPVPPAPTPEEEAMARLFALKQRRPWDRGQGRAAVFELSEIVRAYLGRRLRFDALDLTSEEVLAELRRRRLLGLDLMEVSEELSWQDLVKFARAEPSASDCERAIDRAASLVDRTRALVEMPVRAAAAAGAA